MFKSFWATRDNSTETLGLAATWHPLHNGCESEHFRAARYEASLAMTPDGGLDVDYDAGNAYNMGCELAPGGLTAAQVEYLDSAEFFGRG